MMFRPYVPVAQRRAKAARKMAKRKKQGKAVYPVELEGRIIARSFWGKGWCGHLESFSDYENRLPRGRTYVRNGSVCHLDIQEGRIEAIVSGSEIYDIAIEIKPLPKAKWKRIQERCSGQIGSMLELLQGRFSDRVMAVVTDRDDGMFPKPGEIQLRCSCPDWAVMCKHVAAALYGVGNRLDDRPDLLFLLRGVNAQELIGADIAVPKATASPAGDALADDALGDIFGIELDVDESSAPAPEPLRPKTPRKKKAKATRKTAAKKKARKAQKATTAKKETARGKKRTAAAKSKSKASTLPPVFVNGETTGRRIARLRNAMGCSQSEFAALLGVSLASVRRWEGISGRVKLQTRPRQALAELWEAAAGKRA